MLGYTQRDYGNRVGLWRLFDITDALGIRCTVSLNMACRALPGNPRRDGGARLGVHVARHLQHPLSLDLSREEERAAMEESKEIHQRLTGRRLRGWFSPAITNTLDTFDLQPSAATTTRPICITTISHSR